MFPLAIKHSCVRMSALCDVLCDGTIVDISDIPVSEL